MTEVNRELKGETTVGSWVLSPRSPAVLGSMTDSAKSPIEKKVRPGLARSHQEVCSSAGLEAKRETCGGDIDFHRPNPRSPPVIHVVHQSPVPLGRTSDRAISPSGLIGAGVWA
ncbi:unnamed protein product [Linum trigynum]|uniref:Uncharacterized protein n=1 Tax=Linum trigynum TaxID=586398 RepID=A0AAV2CRK0_9ROSI